MNYEETKIELEYLIARHINDDSVRVAVIRIRENSFFIEIKKDEISKPNWYFIKISFDKKLSISNMQNDYFEEKILELESQIIEILSDFEEEFMFKVNGVWQIV
jgi:hypothetical protein